ncbi:Alcohol dehydrogenase [Caenispirillum salinarum AK4]|uniref:hydroxyacid-oxoacid transhydrogenase n=1 Tax=Caenispirillum salinarum AK4 TaxID=1238182 RepID=K9H2J7_9PROT|nr:hydroxyacid-oxoacid transhydrogenase [Caenispirillum salinarum]EKV31274.1 Alcohol dehydrogenase [Caenispirillum salinarum AK4]
MSATHAMPSNQETIFTVDPVPLKYGHGALAEIGDDAKAMGMTRVALFTDRTVGGLECVATARKALQDAGMEVLLYDTVRVEPTDRSFAEAAAWAQDAGVDGFVSVGGGSVMDTAKAANLLSTWPDELMAYVNAPVGAAKPVPGPLKPHIACPTTSGTGSETTGVAIFDLPERQLKTGISNKLLKPRLAVVDPTATYSLPAGVVAATGFDVLTHAIESYTARPFNSREKPATPLARPPYQGANPWSDGGALEAIRLGGTYLERAALDPNDTEAHDFLTFAATLAGMSFGNAGVHIPHAMSYAVAGLNHEFRAKGYEREGGMVPHGISVVVNAPAAFRFTADACPDRHLTAAAALGADITDAAPDDAGEILATRLAEMMRKTGLPNGLTEIGYTDNDIPALVNSAWPQQRLLAQAPKPVTEDDLADLFRDAMRYW